jgi:succinyl-diaminopimelate desuccinylase
MRSNEQPLPPGAIDAGELIAFTQQLVRVPSVNAPERGRSEEPVAELVAEKMSSFGFEPRIEEVAPGRPNVIAVVDGGAPGPTLMFEGHTDVVTEGRFEDWSFDPFGGEIVGGRLLGRGAADMKGGLAAMLFAAGALAGGGFPGKIVLGALVDEEGMMIGAKHFVASGHTAGVDAAIVCEPEAGEVCAVQKGALRLGFQVTGKMAHGAMPDRGLDPIPALAEIVGLVAGEERRLQERFGDHPLLGRVFLTPTVLHAGDPKQLNVIPGSGWLGVDVRTTPGVDHGELLAALEEVAAGVAKATGAEVGLSVIEDRPPTATPEDAPVVRALQEARAEVAGATAPFGGVPGTTDGTILWRDGHVPVVVYGPGNKWIAHQVDEFVEVDEVVQDAHVYLAAARHFLEEGAGGGR